MERLTGKVTHCCYICKSARSKMKHRTGCNENCDVLKVYNRLNAYEDTRLEPKQVLKIANVFRQFGEEYNCWFNFVVDFVCKYAQAEQDGRLVVLPCKVGDRLFALTSDSITGIEETKCRKIVIARRGNVPCAKCVASCVYDDWGGAFREFYPEDFGKTVFLSHTEAEAALAEVE